MSAPVVTDRVLPLDAAMDDGMSTKIAFAEDPSIALWEKQIQIPAIDGGDLIDVTTMHNLKWRTKATQFLKELSEGSITCSYASKQWDRYVALVNKEQAITIKFPNGAKLAFFGAVRKIEPQDNEPGKQPECKVTFEPTMRDPITKSEEDYIFIPPT